MDRSWSIVAWSKRPRQSIVAHAFAQGLNEAGVPAKVCVDRAESERFIAFGQIGPMEKLVPQAMEAGTPFWLIDNGYYRGTGNGNFQTGYYEMTYRGIVPILMDNPDMERAPDILQPWRRDPDGPVILALPGESFGRALGMDMRRWRGKTEARLRETGRKVIVRPKEVRNTIPLEKHLAGASVLVTHSSNVAIDAVISGIPAIVAPTNPAAPVCSTSLDDLDNPPMPDRKHWWASLMCQQYTREEMRTGTAWRYMRRIMAQVDR